MEFGESRLQVTTLRKRRPSVQTSSASTLVEAGGECGNVVARTQRRLGRTFPGLLRHISSGGTGVLVAATLCDGQHGVAAIL